MTRFLLISGTVVTVAALTGGLGPPRCARPGWVWAAPGWVWAQWRACRARTRGVRP